MHNAFMSYNQKARFGTPTTPGWMPPSIADEVMQRQQQQQHSYQQPMSAPTLPVPTMAPMQMMMPMPMPYGYPIPTPGPSSPKHRSSRHGHSRHSSRDNPHSHRSSGRSSQMGRSRHRRRESSSEESSSSGDEHKRRQEGKHRQRSRPQPRRRSPSTESSSSSTSSSSRTISRRARSSSSSSSSSGSGSSQDESSTAAGRSSGRETTLTANERVQASQSAANALAASAERVRQRTTLSDSIHHPDVAPPTGSDLFKQIQKAYLHYPQADPELKGTPSRSPTPISEFSTSRPSSRYLIVDTDEETDIRTQRTLPRPKLASLAESQGRRAIYPVGASADSAFSCVGYQPVKSPKIPTRLHVQPFSPPLPISTARSRYEEDRLVISKSHPNSAVNSPIQALFPPLEYEPPSSRIASTSQSLPRPHTERMHSRQLSTFSNGQATLAPSQIQAAIQHRSVSEAAFRLDDESPRIATPARAALSAIGSRYSTMPSAYDAAERREIQDAVFDKAALGPNFRDSLKLEHADRSDPRQYVPMASHPYLMQAASKDRPDPVQQDWDGLNGDSSLCCR